LLDRVFLVRIGEPTSQVHDARSLDPFGRPHKIVLGDPEQRPRVWAEHREILRFVLAGDAPAAERAACHHTDRAGAETASRMSQSLLSPGGNCDAADGGAASAI
jgi:hypothetical protein